MGHFVYLEQFSYSSLSSYLRSVSQGTISLFICMAGKLLNLASRSLAQSPVGHLANNIDFHQAIIVRVMAACRMLSSRIYLTA